MTTLARETLEQRPRRSPLLHAAALLLAFASFALLAAWMAGARQGPPSRAWLVAEWATCVLFALEFLTRSGFRWRPGRYALGHLFDFVAVVPVLALASAAAPLLWIVLVARGVRCIDRVLGDGFVQRLVLILAEGFEEEVADRVTLRLLARAEQNLAESRFGTAVGDALAQNRDAVLARMRAATPDEGAGPALARLVGLDKAVATAEARAYDAVVEVLRSREVDDALRAAIVGSFANLRQEVGRREWRARLKDVWRRGRGRANDHTGPRP